MKPLVSVIIVTFNAKEVALKGLNVFTEVAAKDSSNTYEFIVVDNASSDGVADAIKNTFKEVNVIKNSENLGFAKANNIGVKVSKGDYLLFCNPDIEVFEDTVPKLVKFFDSNLDVGVVVPFVRLVKTKELDWPSHRGFPTPWASFCYYSGLQKLFSFSKSLSRLFGKYHLLDRDLGTTHEIDATTGAFFLVKRAVYEKAGGWDEAYFMYAEDLDLSYQIKKLGYKIMFYPEVQVLHYHGLSTGIKKETEEVTKANPKTKLRAFNAFYDTMKIFYDKNLRKQYPEFVRSLVFWGIEFKRKQGLRAKKV